MAAAGMPDGRYQLGPLAVTVDRGVARLRTTARLRGSTATIDRLFHYLALPRLDALVAAATMTATTPAHALGLADVGTLRPATEPTWWSSTPT
jgi:N-acetylglucosamine-6-phosphate deacetylase